MSALQERESKWTSMKVPSRCCCNWCQFPTSCHSTKSPAGSSRRAVHKLFDREVITRKSEFMQFLSWRKLRILSWEKSSLSQGAVLTAQKTCPRWYPLLQIASKSYRHLKIANYLILVMLTIPIRKQFLSNSWALMVFSCLPPRECLTQERASSPLHLDMNTSIEINAQQSYVLTGNTGYKIGYWKSNSLCHFCQMRQQSGSGLLQWHLSSMPKQLS